MTTLEIILTLLSVLLVLWNIYLMRLISGNYELIDRCIKLLKDRLYGNEK